MNYLTESGTELRPIKGSISGSMHSSQCYQQPFLIVINPRTERNNCLNLERQESERWYNELEKAANIFENRVQRIHQTFLKENEEHQN